MKTAKELFPGGFESSYDRVCEYSIITKEIGDLLFSIDLGDYQGDSLNVYKDGSKYGFLSFGYGSCSGCDALQGIESYEELQNFIDGLVNNVKWFDSLQELKDYFAKKDWALEYYGDAEELNEFVKKVLKYSEDDNK